MIKRQDPRVNGDYSYTALQINHLITTLSIICPDAPNAWWH